MILASSIGEIAHPFFIAFAWLIAAFYSLIPNYAVAIALAHDRRDDRRLPDHPPGDPLDDEDAAPGTGAEEDPDAATRPNRG